MSDSPEKTIHSRRQGMAGAHVDPYGASADPFTDAGGSLPTMGVAVSTGPLLGAFMQPADVGFVWQGRSQPPAQGRVVVDNVI